jgi:hypothetical protein
MCGSSTEWTNQGHLAEVTARNGAKRIALYYHDGTVVNGNPNRKIHAECLWYGGGTFAMATRTTTGFQDCMNGADSNTWALRTPRNNTEVVAADLDRGAVLSASRAAVGPWEKFHVFTTTNAQLGPRTTGTFNVRLVARNNGRFVRAENAGANPLVANPGDGRQLGDLRAGGQERRDRNPGGRERTGGANAERRPVDRQHTHRHGRGAIHRPAPVTASCVGHRPRARCASMAA